MAENQKMIDPKKDGLDNLTRLMLLSALNYDLDMDKWHEFLTLEKKEIMDFTKKRIIPKKVYDLLDGEPRIFNKARDAIKPKRRLK